MMNTNVTKEQSFDKERRLSVFRKLIQCREPELLQGTFRLVASKNYEQFLRKVGTGPLSVNMVMRASILLSIDKVRIRNNYGELQYIAFRPLMITGIFVLKQLSKPSPWLDIPLAVGR